MNNINIIKELITSRFTCETVEEIDQHQLAVVVAKNDVHHLLSVLKLEGFRQLSYLSAVDWPEDNVFELVYIVMNWEKALHVQIRTKIDREHPEMASVLPIYPGCKYYERECHEFFGVSFTGNPDHKKQLILEEWDDIPPLRKDFDPRSYSDAHFPKRVYEDRYTVLNNQESKQQKRLKRKERMEEVRKGGLK